MRNLSLLLAVYIFCLTAMPVLAFADSVFTVESETGCCRDICCSSETAANFPISSDENPCEGWPSGICNPFMLCACCSVITIAPLAVELFPAVLETKQGIPLSTGLVSNFLSDCFHPPEFV